MTTTPTDALYDAVRYVLDRTQRDPDLAHHLGPMTEAWERLTAAEALHLGQRLDEVRQRRAVDLQPRHRRREPIQRALSEAARRAIDRLDPVAEYLDALLGTDDDATTAVRRCMEMLGDALEGRLPREDDRG